MNIAKVIVDVPAKATDRAFDYLIPETLRTWIEPGSRVAVPFGKRTVQGFVTSIEPKPEQTRFKLKPIQELLDLVPRYPWICWSLGPG